MKRWERVTYQEHCGGCGRLMLADEPAMAIHIPGVRKVKYRCEECHGSPAPPDLPARVMLRDDIETRVSRLREIAERREWLPHPND